MSKISELMEQLSKAHTDTEIAIKSLINAAINEKEHIARASSLNLCVKRADELEVAHKLIAELLRIHQ